MRKLFNNNWKFMEDDKIDASGANFDDSLWRTLSVPHDWSIEKSYDKENGSGATGYLTGGIGWYRKHFSSENLKDKTVYVIFDGVYNNSELWVNGEGYGFHPYGYSPFYHDITKSLKEKNVISLKVDRTRYIDSRWYTGSGIYRDVELAIVDNLHIPVWGTFITTEIKKNKAQVNIEIDVKNNYDSKKDFDVAVKIFNKNDKLMVEKMMSESVLQYDDKKITCGLTINDPDIWDIENPSLYDVVVEIIVNNEKVDTYLTRFGIREFNFDKEKGFFLNGKNMKIKGVCLHHDAGLVGAAVPKDVWKRRLEKLKECGCNAIRIAHNPASTEFLDLCDEMGFLVQDEFFDEWDYPKDKRLNGTEKHDDYLSRGYNDHFHEWAEKDLKDTMLSHRNHPCVFQWSIGNEIEWTYPRNIKATGFFEASTSGNYFWNEPPYSIEEIKEKLDTLPREDYDIGKTAQKLAKWTREIDTSRPVIANCILPSVSFEAGYTDALDIVGFSYRRVIYDYAKRNYPEKICMGTENLGQWHEWKAVLDREFISGTFLWTGIDYLGEAYHGNRTWPQKGSPQGLLDITGVEKPSYHMYKSLWNENAHVYIATQTEELSMFTEVDGSVVEKEPGSWKELLWQWHDVNKHWNYKNNEKIVVEIYSNCEEVELFLNNNSLGKKNLDDFEDHIYKWAVPFQEGKLRAVGIKGNQNADYEIVSSGGVVGIDIVCDKMKLNANNTDCTHIEVQLIDKFGNPVFTDEKEIEFEITGDIKNLGVDNGSIENVQDHKTNKLVTFKGKSLLILQSGNNSGKVKVLAKSRDIRSEELILTVE